MMRAGLTPERALFASGCDVDAWRTGHGPELLVASMWDFSLERGVALATTMTKLANFLGVLAERRREVELHGVGPRTTSQLVTWLPVVSVLLASAAGFAVVPFLIGTVVGWLLMLVAALLMMCARWWSRRLMMRASYSSWAAGMPAALLALCVGAGVVPPTADEVARIMPSAGYRSRADAELDLGQAFAALERSVEWGVPAAALLEAQAELAQRHEGERLREVGEKLAVSILLPLGVCVLPAFIAVGVIPIIAAMLSSTALR
jgi:tight adherence protein B